MPAATMKAVASSTRKLLRADQEMMRPSMSVPLVVASRRPGCGGGPRCSSGLRYCAWLHCGRLHADDGPLSGRLLHKFESDVLSRSEGSQQRRILDFEIHGHRRPLEAGDRAMGERHARLRQVHGFDSALALVRHGRGRLCARTAEDIEGGAQIALRINQEIRRDHHVLAFADSVCDFDVTIAARTDLDFARLEAALVAAP